MRWTDGSVGPRGVTLLVVTAVAGAVLGVHGWSGRHAGLAASGARGALGGVSSSAGAGSSTAPSPSPSGAGPAGGGTGKAGPLLSSQSFASYSFPVWPARPTPAARTAMTGLVIAVNRTGSGISVRAGVRGQPQAGAHSYRGGARVYVVEASLGDEAGTSDYNLGDDAVVVTDAHGRIVR